MSLPLFILGFDPRSPERRGIATARYALCRRRATSLCQPAD
jgi:hypothetical protein